MSVDVCDIINMLSAARIVCMTFVNANYKITYWTCEFWMAKARVTINAPPGKHGKIRGATIRHRIRDEENYFLYVLVSSRLLFFKSSRKHFSHVTRGCLGQIEIAWKHSPCGLVFPLQFFVLPNFHSCFYNCMETRKMFSISYGGSLRFLQKWEMQISTSKISTSNNTSI